MCKAAVTAGVGAKTLHRWLDQPVFAAAYRKARREMFGHAIGLTQKYAPFAVQTLVKVMAESTSNAASKVAAATALLKFSRESIELDDLAERIDLLEQAATKGASAVRGHADEPAPRAGGHPWG